MLCALSWCEGWFRWSKNRRTGSPSPNSRSLLVLWCVIPEDNLTSMLGTGDLSLAGSQVSRWILGLGSKTEDILKECDLELPPGSFSSLIYFVLFCIDSEWSCDHAQDSIDHQDSQISLEDPQEASLGPSVTIVDPWNGASENHRTLWFIVDPGSGSTLKLYRMGWNMVKSCDLIHPFLKGFCKWFLVGFCTSKYQQTESTILGISNAVGSEPLDHWIHESRHLRTTNIFTQN